MSGYIAMNSCIWAVSQVEPKPTVAVTFRRPAGLSWLARSNASAVFTLAAMSRAVRYSSSPCSVRIRPRAWRWNSMTPSCSSSAPIWREIADWLSFKVSPACVKLPASATAWKIRSLSQSMTLPP